MEEAPPLYTDNIKLKQLSTELYLRISNNYPETSPSHLSLLAVSSKHAYLVAATEAGFLFTNTKHVRETARTGKNNCIPLPSQTTTIVNTNQQPTHIRLSADNATVFVVFPNSLIHLYSAAHLEQALGKNTTSVQPLKQFNLQKNIIDILPNPHDRPDLFAALFQDGTVSLVNTDGIVLTTFSSEFITSICWSPKGKQISCGLKSGKVEQRDTQGTLKNSFAKPQTLSAKDMIVQNILWVENTVFLVAYSVPVDRNAEDPEHDVAMFVVTTDKVRGIVYRDLVDYPAGPYGARTRDAFYYLEYIRKWDHINHLVFVANSPSNDVGLIGNDENGWATWIPDDETDCITLPLPSNRDDQDTENFPVGLALDLSANEPLPALNMAESTEPSDPVPVLMVLTGDGVLACYNVMNITAMEKRIRCEEMVSLPKKLTDDMPKPLSFASVPTSAQVSGTESVQPSSSASMAGKFGAVQQPSPFASVPQNSGTSASSGFLVKQQSPFASAPQKSGTVTSSAFSVQQPSSFASVPQKSGTVTSSAFSIQQPSPIASAPPPSQVSAFTPSTSAQPPVFGKPSTFGTTGSVFGAAKPLESAKSSGFSFAPSEKITPGLFAPPSATTEIQKFAAPSSTTVAKPAPTVKKAAAQSPSTTMTQPPTTKAAEPPRAKPAQLPPTKVTQPPLTTTAQPPVTTTAHRIAQEFENTYREFQDELDALKFNVRASEAIISRLKAPSKRDAKSPGTWTMGDLKAIETMAKEQTEAIQRFSQEAEMANSQAQTISEEMVTASSKDAEIKNYLDALTNEKFQRSIKARKLGPEQADCQMKLRSKCELVGKRLEELQDQIRHVQQKNATHASGKRGNLKAPSLDTIHRTITNISATARGRNADLDQVEEQVRRLGIKSRTGHLSSSTRRGSEFEDRDILPDSRMDAIVAREEFLRKLSESLRVGCRTAPLNESIVQDVATEDRNRAGPVTPWFKASERNVVIAGAVAPTIATLTKVPETQESKPRGIGLFATSHQRNQEITKPGVGLFLPTTHVTPSMVPAQPKEESPLFKQGSPPPKQQVVGLFANVTPPMRETTEEASDADVVEGESEEEGEIVLGPGRRGGNVPEEEEESQTEEGNDLDQYEDLEGEDDEYDDLGEEDEDQSAEEEGEEWRREEDEEDSKRQRKMLPPQSSAFPLFTNTENSLSAFAGAATTPDGKSAFTGGFGGTASSFGKSAFAGSKPLFSFAPPPTSQIEKEREGTVEPTFISKIPVSTTDAVENVKAPMISFGTPSSAFSGNKPLSFDKPLSFNLPASEATPVPVSTSVAGFSFAPTDKVSTFGNPATKTSVFGTGSSEESAKVVSKPGFPSFSAGKTSPFAFGVPQSPPIAESSVPVVTFKEEPVGTLPSEERKEDEETVREEQKETVKVETDENAISSTSKVKDENEATERGESPFEILESGGEGTREQESSEAEQAEQAEVSREESRDERDRSDGEEGEKRFESVGEEAVSSSESEGDQETGSVEKGDEQAENGEEEEESSRVEFLEEFRASPTEEEGEEGEEEEEEVEEESHVEDLSEFIPSEEARDQVEEEEPNSLEEEPTTTTTTTNNPDTFTICSTSSEGAFGGGSGIFGTPASSAFAGFGTQSSFLPSPPQNHGMDEGEGGDAMTDDDIGAAANVAPGFGGFGLGGQGTTQGKTSIYGTAFSNSPSAFGSSVSGFGAAAENSPSSSFGTPTSGFLAPATGFGKSLNASPSPSFGTVSGGGFLASPTGFGKSLTSTTSAFGSNSFGGSGGFSSQQQGGFAATGFGAFGNAPSSSGAFGNAPSSSGAFGNAPSSSGAFGNTPSSTGFGIAPSSTGFGNTTSSTGFGNAPSSTGFGNKPSSTGFGTSSQGVAFGQPSALGTSAFGQTSTLGMGSFGGGGGNLPAFGKPSALGMSNSSFGQTGSTFGSAGNASGTSFASISNNPTGFGTGSSSFAGFADPNRNQGFGSLGAGTAGGGGFGTTTTNTGGFGSSGNSNSNVFGGGSSGSGVPKNSSAFTGYRG